MNIFDRLSSYKSRILFQEFGIPRVKNEVVSKHLFKQYLCENPIIIDCGAYDGRDSIELAKVLKGRIYSFEPIESLFNRLVKNTKKYSNIYCQQIALSDHDGVQTFYVSEGESLGSSSLLEPKDHLVDHPNTFFNKKIDVQAFTLDSWARYNNISKVDMLWLDMQGYEVNMLNASNKILPTVRVIHTEVSLKETYKGVITYPKYRKFLESLGFKVVVEAIPEGWDMGNVVFARV